MNDKLTKEQEAEDSIEERLLTAVKNDQSETCEQILEEESKQGINGETVWENVEKILKMPIFYYVAIKQSWKTVPVLVSKLSKIMFTPFVCSSNNEMPVQEENKREIISTWKRSNDSQLKESDNRPSKDILRKKNALHKLSIDEKLHESLVMLLNNNKVNLIDKFLHGITNQETLRNLISKTKNELGDFLIHIAARNNLTDLLTFILSESNPNERNLMGETALHLAAEGGCLEAVKILKRDDRIEVDAKDMLNNTPLHSSVNARLPKVEIVQILADDTLRKPRARSEDDLADDVSRISLRNKLGRTPLHLAAIHMSSNRSDCIGVIKALQDLDSNAKDNVEETALHIAAKMRNMGVLEAMLEVFYGLHKDVYKHANDKDGYSLLDVSAMKADPEMVTLLIDYGANPRDGVLYHLVSESVRVPEKAVELVKVYRTIIDQTDKWSRFRSNEDKLFKKIHRGFGITGTVTLNFPCNYSEHTSDNMISLLTQKGKNNLLGCENFNVIEHAVDEGAVTMLEEIMHTKQLYENTSEVKSSQGNTTKPSASNEIDKDSNKYRFMFKGCIKEKGQCCDEKNMGGCNMRCLIEKIVNRPNDEIVAKMLNIEPIKSVVNGYANIARVFYGLMTLAQIIYMTCFSIYHIPNACRFDVGRGAKYSECNITNTSELYHKNYFSHLFANKSSTCAYVIWPLLLLTSGILCNIQDFLHQKRRLIWMDIWSYCFPVLAIIWLCIFQYPVPKYNDHVAFTALVFIIGWLHVFYFISFFERFNKFAFIIKEIILNDVLNFILLIATLLIGFSCAIVTLYQTKTPGEHSYRSLTGTAYRAFFDTLSPGSTFLNETTNTDYASLGGKLNLLRVVIVTYEILTCVILMNILIAMMSDTYNKEIANAELKSRICLVRSVINLRCWFNFGHLMDDIHLDAKAVNKIIGHRTDSNKNKSSFYKICDCLKQRKKSLTQHSTTKMKESDSILL